MQEVVDATLLEKVETSIESNKSLQMLDIDIEHSLCGGSRTQGSSWKHLLEEVDHRAVVL